VAVRILVYGEDENDRDIIRELIVAICPSAAGRVEKRRRPPMFVKGGSSTNLAHRAQKFAAAVRADESANGPVSCVFVHEDADGLPPEDEVRGRQMRDACANEGLDVIPVVPAWEIEAWFFLFPAAVARGFPSWRRLPERPGARVDFIENAKERFRALTAPPGGKRRYVESDGRRIASCIRELGLADSPVGEAAAFTRFREDVAGCCTSGHGHASHGTRGPTGRGGRRRRQGAKR
jgi:hypothetical protein